MRQSYVYYRQNYGSFFDKVGAGITGPVKLRNAKTGATLDLSSQNWTYQVNFLSNPSKKITPNPS